MRLLILTLLIAIYSSSALASLGQKPKKKGKFIKAVGRTIAQSRTPKWVTETPKPGSRLREYSKDDKSNVYALAWSGKRHPDFRSLLGPYTQEYDDAIAAQKDEKHKRIRGRSRVIQTEHLKIYLHGHAMNMWGRITVPSLMPEGVREDEIQ